MFQINKKARKKKSWKEEERKKNKNHSRYRLKTEFLDERHSDVRDD